MTRLLRAMCAALLFSTVGCLYANNGDSTSVEVILQKAVAVDWQQPVYLTGSLNAIQGIEVSPEVGGKVTAVHVKSGDSVRAGQPLVQLNPDVLKGELAAAKAALELSRLNYLRAEQLYKTHSISDSDYDRSRSEYQQNDGNVQTLAAQLAQTTITSPIDGVVGIVTPQIGDFVTAGESLFNVDNLAQLWIDFDLPQNYMTELKAGDTVLVRSGKFQKGVYRAKVVALDSAVDSSNRTIKVRAVMNNKDHTLRPGAYVSVVADVGEPTKAVKIPQIAVLPSLGGEYVYVSKEGVAVRTPVTIIGQTDDLYILSKGLAAGEAIVVSGLQKVSEGSKLKDIGTKKKAAASKS